MCERSSSGVISLPAIFWAGVTGESCARTAKAATARKAGRRALEALNMVADYRPGRLEGDTCRRRKREGPKRSRPRRTTSRTSTRFHPATSARLSKSRRGRRGRSSRGSRRRSRAIATHPASGASAGPGSHQRLRAALRLSGVLVRARLRLAAPELRAGDRGRRGRVGRRLVGATRRRSSRRSGRRRRHFFRNLPDAAWSREGIASGNPFTVRALAWIAAGHVAHHVGVLKDRYL